METEIELERVSWKFYEPFHMIGKMLREIGYTDDEIQDILSEIEEVILSSQDEHEEDDSEDNDKEQDSDESDSN